MLCLGEAKTHKTNFIFNENYNVYYNLNPNGNNAGSILLVNKRVSPNIKIGIGKDKDGNEIDNEGRVFRVEF